ncbi:Integrase core domain protein (plasmid) [Piscirickettsia salmonis]|nr:Integrase core domain protein [Piscirickettsia salmonis]
MSEKAKQEKEAHGEIETEHPGYLGSQDTYYVGTMKGVGRIYQQTFVDTYSRVAFACLYTEKNAVTAAHALNESVIPWFEERDTPLLRILTDRGTEYCGKIEHRKRRYLGRYFAHPMMQNRRAKRDDYKPSAVRVTQRYVP